MLTAGEIGSDPAPGAMAQVDARGIVVLGFGNVLLGDDGAGVQAMERLRDALDPAALHPLALDFVDAGTLSYSLLPYVEQAAALLVIDAANLDALPGTVRMYEDAAMDRFLLSTRRRTVHEVGLTDLLDMARLRDALPPRRALLCIQPQRLDWGHELSAPVAAAMDGLLRQATGLLQRWRG